MFIFFLHLSRFFYIFLFFQLSWERGPSSTASTFLCGWLTATQHQRDPDHKAEAMAERGWGGAGPRLGALLALSVTQTVSALVPS